MPVIIAYHRAKGKKKKKSPFLSETGTPFEFVQEAARDFKQWRANEHCSMSYSPSNNNSITRMHITQDFSQLVLQLTHSTTAVLHRKTRLAISIAIHSSAKFVCFHIGQPWAFLLLLTSCCAAETEDPCISCFPPGTFYRQKKNKKEVIIHCYRL